MTLRRAMVVGLLAAAAGCGRKSAGPPAAAVPPPARRTPTTSSVAEAAPAPSRTALEALLADDMAPDGGFPWSASRALRWRDFQGPPPDGGQEAARTAYGLFYGWRCRGQAFEFQVTAAFLTRKSWVKGATLRDSTESRRVLRHEQTHFDLAETYARRMRQTFLALPDACGQSDDQLSALAQRVIREEKAAQQRYDVETGHGLVAAKQSEWDREVARQLAAPPPAGGRR